MKSKTVAFDNEIIKQGNSYCVRIPKGALEYLEFELGDTVRVKLSKPKKENLPKDLLEIYKNTIKDLENFSYKEINDCFFSFNVETSVLKNLGDKEKERTTEAFEKTIELQKGKNFLKKFKIFKKSITKKNTEKIIRKLKKSKYSELAKSIEMQTKQSSLV
jgi:antitoxin component of MazEF toxin-antitoxin module